MSAAEPERVPSFFMLVPGPWRAPGSVIAALAKRAIHAVPMDGSPPSPGAILVDIVSDDGLVDAFRFGRAGRLPDALLARISAVNRAALLEVALRVDADHASIAALGERCETRGGIAVRMEGSGAASEWETWLESFESGTPALLYQSAVLIVGGDGEFFTCGMHQFDLPDAQIEGREASDAIRWLDAFCVYQLAEEPVLGTGHGFQPDADTPRRSIERWPDHRHAPSDGRYNPFGLWRALPEGAQGLDALDPVPVHVPSLVAVLMAQERAHGRALTQAEVEAITDSSTAMAMELRHAVALERSRGYADLEPRRAWEQWQLVRENGR